MSKTNHARQRQPYPDSFRYEITLRFKSDDIERGYVARLAEWLTKHSYDFQHGMEGHCTSDERIVVTIEDIWLHGLANLVGRLKQLFPEEDNTPD